MVSTCLGSSVYNVSSVQCPVSSVHTMTSCPRGEEGVQAELIVTPVIIIFSSLTVDIVWTGTLCGDCVVEALLVSH